MDSTQLLSRSHVPDLLYLPELIAFAVLGALAFAARRGTVAVKDPALVFAASFALLPIAVFNQQILTGRSLQPIHYQVFIANYLVLAGGVLAAQVLIGGRKDSSLRIPGRPLIYVALIALGWGVVELAGATRRNAANARIRDDSMPVIGRLAEIARQDGTYETARQSGSYPTVYSTNLMVASNIATGAPQGILFAQHIPAAGVADLDETRELFYYYLYYSGTDEKALAEEIVKGRLNTLSTLFGLERVITLTSDAKPITGEDMRTAVSRYADFIHSFSRERAARPLLSYVVAPTDAEPDYANLDRWYERDGGEHVGIYVIYRVKLRP